MENRIAQVEQCLNPFDRVPFVSTFSGAVRILAGIVQMAAGVALAALKSFCIVMTGRGYYGRAIDAGLYYFIHGLANVMRGAIALEPWTNLILIVYDKYIGRMNYQWEKMRPGVYPIMTAHRLSELAQY